MRYGRICWTAGCLLLISSLVLPSHASPKFAGIYVHAVGATNGTTLSGQNTVLGSSAFNNPLIRGITLNTTWYEVEPLPPGLSFTSAGGSAPYTFVVKAQANGAAAPVTLSCLHPGTGTYANYCWDTIDQQLDLLLNSTFGASSGSTVTLTNNSPFSIGIDVNAGYHSPAWLSTIPISVNLQGAETGSRISLDFSPGNVATAQSAGGSYSGLGTVSCASYAGSSSGTVCGFANQVFTSWMTFIQGNAGTACDMVKLPVPYSGSPANGIAPFAAQYDQMLTALENHLASYVTNLNFTTNNNHVTGFANVVRLVKMGGALGGQDSELTLLYNKNVGTSSVYFPLEYNFNTAVYGPCPMPYIASASYPLQPNTGEKDWMSLGYNPLYVQKTLYNMTDAAANTFVAPVNPSPNKNLLQQIEMVLDVHSDNPFPPISFVTNDTRVQTFTAYGNLTASTQASYGPSVQDDIVLCGLGTKQPNNGTAYSLSDGVGLPSGTAASTGAYYSGFFAAGGTGTTVSCTDSLYPTWSIRGNGYHWAIQEDGLKPPSQTTTPLAVYAHGAAQGTASTAGTPLDTGDLVLSWSTNEGKNGARCDFTVMEPAGDCSSAASSTDPLVALFDSMLEYGAYVAPQEVTNGPGQTYGLFSWDACNPFLWQAFVNLNAKIGGPPTTLGSLTGTYNNCSNVAGTFSGGVWQPQ